VRNVVGRGEGEAGRSGHGGRVSVVGNGPL
jgi:hypothetical protein